MSTRRATQRDPFRALAIVAIVLGMAIVVFAVVFWAATNRESSLLVGAGITLSTVGGLRNYLADTVGQVPAYEQPSEPTEAEAGAKPKIERRKRT